MGVLAIDSECCSVRGGVDSHYTYTAQNTQEDDSDDDSDSGDNAIEIDESILGNIDVKC